MNNWVPPPGWSDPSLCPSDVNFTPCLETRRALPKGVDTRRRRTAVGGRHHGGTAGSPGGIRGPQSAWFYEQRGTTRSCLGVFFTNIIFFLKCRVPLGWRCDGTERPFGVGQLCLCPASGWELRFLRALPCLLQPAGENAGALGSCWGALEVRRKRRRRQRSAPGRCQLDALRPASVRGQAGSRGG